MGLTFISTIRTHIKQLRNDVNILNTLVRAVICLGASIGWGFLVSYLALWSVDSNCGATTSTCMYEPIVVAWATIGLIAVAVLGFLIAFAVTGKGGQAFWIALKLLLFEIMFSVLFALFTGAAALAAIGALSNYGYVTSARLSFSPTIFVALMCVPTILFLFALRTVYRFLMVDHARPVRES